MATIEEKAKRYDEAIERAKELLEIGVKDTRDKRVVLSFFPELAESEDERIKTALLEMVHDTTGDSLWVDYNVHKEDVLDWLEKQGSQIPANSAKTCKDEQKHAWSEEDETGLTNTIIMLKEGASIHFNKNDITKAVDWLKSLKNRVQPQHKQEWSEEEEAVLDALIRRLEGEDIYVSPHLAVECLKTLRPHLQWKPSEEQMEALKEASDKDWDVDGNSPLYRLYEQLKAL